METIKEEIKRINVYLGVHPDSEIRDVLEARLKELEDQQLSNSAEYVKEVTVIDPDSRGAVEMSVFKHESGGMFAVDSAYLDQCFDDDTDPRIPDPFSANENVENVQYVKLYNL